MRKRYTQDMLKGLCLVLLLAGFPGAGPAALAQERPEKPAIVSGQVISDRGGMPVATASVMNISRGKGTITDTLGFFNIRAFPSDTLRFSHVGFISKYVFLADSSNTDFMTVELPKAYHMLDEVDVKSLSWHKFKHEIVNKPAPEPERYGTDTALTSLDKAAADFMNSGPGVGVSLPLNIQTDAQKQYAQLEKLKQRDRREKVIHQKFNHDMVRKVTGLEGEALTDFVLWMQLPGVFLYHATQYSIIKHIQKMYRRYRGLKLASGDTLPPLDTLHAPKPAHR